MSRSTSRIVREYGPFAGADDVHGVTYDGHDVWFAAGDKLIAFDPASGNTLRSLGPSAPCAPHASLRWRRRSKAHSSS